MERDTHQERDMDLEESKMKRWRRIRKNCEVAYARDPFHVNNLTRWATASLQLSSFLPIAEAKTMIQDAILKLDEALEVNPRKYLALFQMTNAYSRLARLTSDPEEKVYYFSEASEYLYKSYDKEPDDEFCREILPASYEEYYAAQEFEDEYEAAKAAVAGPSSPFSAKTAPKKKNSDLKYDIMGWVIVALGIVAISVYARRMLPPPR